MKKPIIIATLLSATAIFAAPIVKTLVIDGARAIVTHGQFARLPDGGVKVACSGIVTSAMPDGGPVSLGAVGEAEAPALNAALNLCLVDLRKVNDLER